MGSSLCELCYTQSIHYLLNRVFAFIGSSFEMTMATRSKAMEQALSANQGESSLSKPVGRIKAKHVKDSMAFKEGDINIVSLSSGDSLPEGINDIVADFSAMQKSTIKSFISPITMTLKKNMEKKKITLGPKKWLMDKLTGTGLPFLRFDKIQFLYLPLMDNDAVSFKDMNVTFTLEDLGKGAAGFDPVVSKSTFPIHEMALAELFMDYFIEKKDLEQLQINVSVNGIPILKRSYACVFIAFFVHEEQIPSRVTPKRSTLVFIDPSDCPADLNKKTVLSKISDVVQTQVKGAQDRLLAAKAQNNVEERIRKRNFALEEIDEEQVHAPPLQRSNSLKSSSSGGSAEAVIAAGRRSVDHITAWKEGVIIPKNVPSRSLKNHYKHKNLLTILDTGSDTHFFYQPTINPNDSITAFGGVDYMELEEGAMLYSANDESFLLPSVQFFSDPSGGTNILSYSKLRDAGIVDSMTTRGDNGYLMKGDEIRFNLCIKKGGRMIVKDEAYLDGVKSDNLDWKEHNTREKKTLEWS